MKKRPKGFLADQYCPDESEIGDYIRELHQYLWRTVNVVLPGAGGRLSDYLDICIQQLERDQGKASD